MKRVKFIMMLMVFCMSTFASQARIVELGVWDSKNPHALSVTIGSYPLLPSYYSSQSYFFGYNYVDDAYFEPLEDPSFYKAKRISSPMFNLNYTYRLNRSFAVGCSLSAGVECNRINNYYDDTHAFNSCDYVTLLTPAVYWYWLNTKHVEMYTSFGFGVGCALSTNVDYTKGNTDFYNGGSVQWTPIGAAIKFNSNYFAIAELGVGSMGCFKIGAGYRF